MNHIKVYLFTIKLCWRALFDIHLGTYVLYEGEMWMLTQGCSDPLWNIHRLSDNLRMVNVHRSKFHKIKSLRNYIHDVRFTWRFYSSNWFYTWFSDPSQMRSYP